MMKKSILLFIMALSLTPLFAQLEKGNFILGGSFSLSKNADQSEYLNNESSDNSTGYAVSPSIGYLITNNVAIGTIVSFGQSWSTSETTTENTHAISKKQYTQYGFGLFGTYYKSIAGNFKIAITNTAKYENFSQKEYYEVFISDFGEAPEDTHWIRANYIIDLKPQIVYFITPKLSIESSLGSINYTLRVYQSDNPESTTRQDLVRVSFNPSMITFGFKYNF